MTNKINLDHGIIDHLYINVRKGKCPTSRNEYTHDVFGGGFDCEEYRYSIVGLHSFCPCYGVRLLLLKEQIITDLLEDTSANSLQRFICTDLAHGILLRPLKTEKRDTSH